MLMLFLGYAVLGGAVYSARTASRGVPVRPGHVVRGAAKSALAGVAAASITNSLLAIPNAEASMVQASSEEVYELPSYEEHDFYLYDFSDGGYTFSEQDAWDYENA